MDVVSNREETIYKTKYNDKIYYSIKLSKKNQDGKYDNGFIPVRFKKDIEVTDREKIVIKNAWLDFYTKDKKTFPYIFINEFERPEAPKITKIEEHNGNSTKQNPYAEFGNSITTEVQQQFEYTDDDLPF